MGNALHQGPCCGEADCTCKYLLGSQVLSPLTTDKLLHPPPLEPLELQPSKPGSCFYSLVSSPGSQVEPPQCS